MPDTLQFHVITILDIEHLHYKCYPNWNKKYVCSEKRSSNHRDTNILEISSHATNQKLKKYPSNLPDLWSNDFWVVHYLTWITKCSGHQPKNPKLDKTQAACFLLIIRKVAFSSLGRDWLNQSLGNTAKTVCFKIGCSWRTVIYSCFQCIDWNSPKTAWYSWTHTKYQVCAQLRSSMAKPFARVGRPCSACTTCLQEIQDSYNQLFYIIFSCSSATNAISN